MRGESAVEAASPVPSPIPIVVSSFQQAFQLAIVPARDGEIGGTSGGSECQCLSGPPPSP